MPYDLEDDLQTPDETSGQEKPFVFLPFDFLAALLRLATSIEDHLSEALEGHPARLLRALTIAMERLSDEYCGYEPKYLADELDEMADYLDDHSLSWSGSVEQELEENGGAWNIALYGEAKPSVK